MKLGYLAYRNMISKPLNLVLSLMLLVLSISLVTFVLQLGKQLNGQLDKNIAPVDMVVGAKGSPLQLVLSSVLHLDVPTGNIPLKEAEGIKKHPFVESAIPVSYGDNHKGYRILGTELAYFKSYNATLAKGRFFDHSFEVVAGSSVAKKLGLEIGDNLISSHGLAAQGGEAHEDQPYTVVGLLDQTGTVIDQLLVTNLESIWDAHDHTDGEHESGEAHNEDGETHDEEANGHDHDDHDHEAGAHEQHGDGHDHEAELHGHDDHDHEHDHEHEEEAHDHEEDAHTDSLEITSLLVKFKSPLGLVQLPRYINENTNMQAALPGFEVQRLMGLLGSGAKTINGIAIAILLVSGFSIFISLLKTIRERRQELALLRTYGMGTPKLLLMVGIEGLLLALFGFLMGWSLGRLALILASRYMESGYGYALKIQGPDLMELAILGATLLLALLAVFLASTSIFKLNISKTLSNA